MTGQERADAVARLGFTERQARFLVTVMTHSGVCLPRQYTAFAGIVYGQKTRRFFAKLIAEGYASTCRCLHNRAVVYHVDGRPVSGERRAWQPHAPGGPRHSRSAAPDASGRGSGRAGNHVVGRR